MKSPKEEPQHSIKPNREVSVAIQKISRNPSSPVLSRKRAGSALLPHHFSADATFDEDSWTTPKEPKRSWAELENPNSVNDLFKTDKAISQGFHFEFGNHQFFFSCLNPNFFKKIFFLFFFFLMKEKMVSLI